MADVSVNERDRITEASETSLLHYRPQAGTFPAKFEHTQELTTLQEAFQQASTGERRLVFLHGEQSIGKTALLDTFLAEVHRPGLPVLRARCVQMGCVAEPFLPLLEALERHCREPDGKLIIERLNHVAPTWLYQMLNVLDPDEIALLQQKVSHINSGRMLREGADFFETLSNDATLYTDPG